MKSLFLLNAWLRPGHFGIMPGCLKRGKVEQKRGQSKQNPTDAVDWRSDARDGEEGGKEWRCGSRLGSSQIYLERDAQC